MPKAKLQLSAPQRALVASAKPLNLYMGGQGSGKTFAAGYLSARLAKLAGVSGFIGANTYGQLSDSTLRCIFEVWQMMGLQPFDPAEGSGDYVVGQKPPDDFHTDDHFFQNYRNKVAFRWGTVVYLGSLENYKAHDGKEFAWALLDETKDTREEAVKEVILGRLRQKGLYLTPKGKLSQKRGKAYNPLFIFTSPAKVAWLNEWFELEKRQEEVAARIYREDDFYLGQDQLRQVVISSTYLNRHNLPEGYIENRKAALASWQQDMLIYGSPFAKAGGEFYKCFDRSRHVADLSGQYRPEEALHLSFDFNVQPYITLTVWQIRGSEAFQLDEICLQSPHNRSQDLCREFARRYPHHQGGLLLYGDPSGRQGDTRAGLSDYDLILKELAPYHPQLRVARSAPPVVQRANFLNSIFEKESSGIRIRIDKHCTRTIGDYLYLKEDADGTKLKKRQTDPETGISYEPLGHTSDANDYLLVRAFEAAFKSFAKGPKTPYRVGKRKARRY